MTFDPLADPWGTALLAQGTIAVAAGVGACVPALRRGGGWLMGLSLAGFLGTSVAGAWVRVHGDQARPPVASATTVPDAAGQGPRPAPSVGADAEPERGDGTDASAPSIAPPSPAAPTPADPEQQRADARRALHEGKRVATSEDLCLDPAAVGEAWRQVALIPADVYAAKARVIAERLEGCRKKVSWTVRYAIHKQRVEAREAFAEQLPARLQTRGITSSAAVHGMSHERLRVGVRGTYDAPLDRVISPELAQELEQLGFTDVYVSFGKLRAQQAFDPRDEREIIEDELRRHGLDAPLTR